MLLSGCSKPAPADTATPTPTPAPTAVATPTPLATVAETPTPAPTETPVPTVVPKYNGAQQAEYIKTAQNAFIALRTEKSQAFVDAYNTLNAAGGMSGKGLKTKADLTARRDMAAKALAANQAYSDFVKTQDDTYRAELAKTPLIPGEVDAIVADFEQKANTPVTLQLREAESKALQAGDEMLAALDKKFGTWTVSDAGKISFKKKTDIAAFSDLATKYNARVADIQKLREQLVPTPTSSPAVVSPAS